jgi:hypothetical protein
MTDGPSFDGAYAAKPVRLVPSKAKAALLTVIILLFVMLYISVSIALGIESLYGAIFFSIYFMALKKADLREFLPSLLGSAFGIAVAILLSQIPLMFSPPVALVLSLLVTLITIFGLVAQLAPQFMNLAQVIFLSVCTIPKLSAFAEQLEVAKSLAFGAAIIGLGTVGYQYFDRSRRRPGAVPTAA